MSARLYPVAHSTPRTVTSAPDSPERPSIGGTGTTGGGVDALTIADVGRTKGSRCAAVVTSSATLTTEVDGPATCARVTDARTTIARSDTRPAQTTTLMASPGQRPAPRLVRSLPHAA